jgi:hypothetical protein
MKQNSPLHIRISTLFVTLIVIVGILIGGSGYESSRYKIKRTVHIIQKDFCTAGRTGDWTSAPFWFDRLGSSR